MTMLNGICQTIPQLKITPNGVEPIVVEVKEMSASEIYSQAKKWVQETYDNPSEVLKADLVNEKIRIDGFVTNAWWCKPMGITQNMDMNYQLEISFKDGKYRFEYTVGQFYPSGGGGQKAMYTYTIFWKNNGDVRHSYADAIPSIEKTMNSLSMSFYKYIIGKKSEKDSDW